MAETFTSIHGAIIAGLIAAGIFAVFARLSTLNVMNTVRYLSTLFSSEPNAALGWFLHFAIGCVLALIYVAVWNMGLRPSDFYLYSLIAGIVHWLIAGIVIGAAPAVHAGIRAGAVPAPGIYMSNIMGVWGFIAGLTGHILFGFTVIYFYQFFCFFR
ncbi:MAG TPA: hypothetical protein VMT71_08445 [Syntrophorhabdales bacterium]|nr:hypothetical protein [Syntrophorhabdales bacterium]